MLPEIINLSLWFLNALKCVCILWVARILACARSVCGLPVFQPFLLDSALEL